MTVLIIEDDFSIVGMIRAAVKRHGITIEHATSISKAIKITASVVPDLVWTDVGISADEYGTDIFRHVSDEVPAIVCTGYEKGGLGFGRYWKYVPKSQLGGSCYVSIILRAYFASKFMRSILQGNSCKEMGKFLTNEISSNVDAIKKGIIDRMFASETQCLDAWISGDKEKSVAIASGLLDGSLC